MCEVCKGLHRYACYMQRLDLIHEVYMVGVSRGQQGKKSLDEREGEERRGGKNKGVIKGRKTTEIEGGEGAQGEGEMKMRKRRKGR